MSGMVQRATTCYMTDGSERGPAYAFWLRVKTKQAERGWSDSELYRRSGVSRNTIKGLKNRTRTEADTVNNLADALDIPRDEAYRLAGLLPSDEPAPQIDTVAVDARLAILHEPIYTEEQRQAMLTLHDFFAGTGRDED
jgi:transcriptional regulator with XRE-family HTH domain